MADIPDTIVLKRDRDLEGRAWEIWVRRGLFALLPLIALLALVDLFGQRPSSSVAATPRAELDVFAPERLRGGLLFQARFTVRAEDDLAKATLVLSSAWLEGMTVNTVEPQPVNEGSADGKLTLELGHVPAGQSYVLYMSFQVNPTNVGRREASVDLLDGSTRLTHVSRTFTVFP